MSILPEDQEAVEAAQWAAEEQGRAWEASEAAKAEANAASEVAANTPPAIEPRQEEFAPIPMEIDTTSEVSPQMLAEATPLGVPFQGPTPNPELVFGTSEIFESDSLFEEDTGLPNEEPEPEAEYGSGDREPPKKPGGFDILAPSGDLPKSLLRDFITKQVKPDEIRKELRRARSSLIDFGEFFAFACSYLSTSCPLLPSGNSEREAAELKLAETRKLHAEFVERHNEWKNALSKDSHYWKLSYFVERHHEKMSALIIYFLQVVGLESDDSFDFLT